VQEECSQTGNSDRQTVSKSQVIQRLMD
jgi:hypothetical protein